MSGTETVARKNERTKVDVMLDAIWNWICTVDLIWLIKILFNLSLLLMVGMYTSPRLRRSAYTMFNVGICGLAVLIRTVVWISAINWRGTNGTTLANIVNNHVLLVLFFVAVLGRLIYVFGRSTLRVELAAIKREEHRNKIGV